jgi:hypothetical protein
MFDGVKGMPAKVCLGLSALIMLVYAMNFIFFANCYTTDGTDATVDMDTGVWMAGEACTSILTNGAALDSENFGRGVETLQLLGALMLGLAMSNLLILNEGAKGKWSLMLPIVAGLVTMSIVMIMGRDELPNNNPLIATIFVTAAYTGAYFFLKEEGVDDGLTFEVKGIQVKDKVTTGLFVVPVIIGVVFSINNLLFADGYAGKADSSTFLPVLTEFFESEPHAATPLQIQLLGSLFVPYTLFAVNILRTGPREKWPLGHISMFGIGYFALTTIMVLLFNEDSRWNAPDDVNAQLVQNVIITSIVWVCVSVGYMRLRDEGIEDGMTLMGEEPADKDIFLMKMYPAIMVVMAVILIAVRMM